MAGERFAAEIADLESAVLDTPGDLSPEVRRRLFTRAVELCNEETPSADPTTGDPLGDFADKIAKHAYKVTQVDIDRLREDGYTEDAVFESILAVAAGAGLGRLRRGLDALSAALNHRPTEGGSGCS